MCVFQKGGTLRDIRKKRNEKGSSLKRNIKKKRKKKKLVECRFSRYLNERERGGRNKKKKKMFHGAAFSSEISRAGLPSWQTTGCWPAKGRGGGEDSDGRPAGKGKPLRPLRQRLQQRLDAVASRWKRKASRALDRAAASWHRWPMMPKSEALSASCLVGCLLPSIPERRWWWWRRRWRQRRRQHWRSSCRPDRILQRKPSFRLADSIGSSTAAAVEAAAADTTMGWWRR